MRLPIASLLLLLCIAIPGCNFCVKKDTITDVEHGLLYPIIIPGQTNPGMSITERMNYYVTPAASIAIINEGKLAWAKGYGYTSFKSDKKIVNTNTLFQAASISKPLTAIGVLTLVDQGRVTLDEDVNHYLTSWKVPDNEFTTTEKVTLRRLLLHTAGITPAGFIGYAADIPIPSLLEILDGTKPANNEPIRVVQTPGKEYRYSSKGTVVIQQLIEDVTGEKFDVWMKHNVLIPFGMHASTFSQPLAAEYAGHAAHGYNQDGTPVKGNWFTFPELAPAGLWSTPTDLAQFLLTLLSIMRGERKNLISQKLIKDALTPQLYRADGTGVGFGFFIKGKGKEVSFGHGGANTGYLANMRMYPELNKGWIVMIDNRGAQGLPAEIERSIAKAYNIPGYSPTEKKIVPLPSSSYPAYTGTYKDLKAPAHTMIITTHDNALFLADSYIPSHTIQLYHAGNDTFFAKELIEWVTEDYAVSALKFVRNHDQRDQMNTLILLDSDGKTLLDENTQKEMILQRVAL